MPYAVRRKGNRYQVVNTDTGRVYSTTNRVGAEKRLRVLRGIERDWKSEGDDTFTRTVNGRTVRMQVK